MRRSSTLGTKAGISYSVDASAATVIKQGATSMLSAIATGDAVVVQGAVNGSAITASSILDQGAPKPAVHREARPSTCSPASWG